MPPWAVMWEGGGFNEVFSRQTQPEMNERRYAEQQGDDGDEGGGGGIEKGKKTVRHCIPRKLCSGGM